MKSFKNTLRQKKIQGNFSKYMKAQSNAIDNSKYIESEKARRDLYFDEQGKPSENFFIWWISNHSRNFRNAWNLSLCKKCVHVSSCKDCLKIKCSIYVHDPKSPFKISYKKQIRRFHSEQPTQGGTYHGKRGPVS